MFDTPRSNRARVGRYDTTGRCGLMRSEYIVRDSYREYVPAEVAEQLERELNEAVEQLVKLKAQLQKVVYGTDNCEEPKS